jgi:dTDP-4-dehydrorhamnose 3,5-epimerase
MNLKALVIGANGQLGRAFQQVWPEATFLARTDLDLAWGPNEIKNTLLGTFKEEGLPNVIFLCAAYTAVDRAETEELIALQVNASAPYAIARLCQSLGIYLVHFSTDYVFDGRQRVPISEAEQPNPQSVYGRTKQAGEQSVIETNPQAWVIRLSYVFGDGPNLVQALLKAAKENWQIRVVSDQIIRPTYAPDVAAKIRKLLERGARPSGILHLQNAGPPVSIASLAKRIIWHSGLLTEVVTTTLAEYFAGRDGTATRPAYSVFDVAEAKRLGIYMTGWRNALLRYLDTL